jgi:hypothetical protein
MTNDEQTIARLEADLARARNDRDLIKSALHQVESALAQERTARRTFDADSAQLRAAVLAYVQAASYAERFKARAELQVLATVEHPGTLLLRENAFLRQWICSELTISDADIDAALKASEE